MADNAFTEDALKLCNRYLSEATTAVDTEAALRKTRLAVFCLMQAFTHELNMVKIHGD